jgi:hypothetical protein
MFSKRIQSRLSASLLMSFSFVGVAKTTKQTTTVATTICEIARRPEAFLGRKISFDAIVESDGIERTVLIDDRDQSCKRGIVPLAESKNRQSVAAWKTLQDALASGNPGTLDKRITGHFAGALSLGKPEDFGAPHGTKVFTLAIESIQNLRVEKMVR